MQVLRSGRHAIYLRVNTKNGAAPKLGASMDTRYLQGIVTEDERMLSLMDIENLMVSRDMWLVALAVA